MTSKERILVALRNGKPDRVPVSPDISVLVPDRLTGKPFYDIMLDGREHYGWTSATHGEVYVQAIDYFNMDGFYMYGGLKQVSPKGRPQFRETITDVPEGKKVARVCETPLGNLTEVEVYPVDDAPWRHEKPIKDLQKDFEKMKYMMGHSDWEWESSFRDKDVIDDRGIYMGMIPVFQDWYFNYRQGGFEQMIMDFINDTALVEEIYDFWTNWALANVQAMLTAKADVIMLGGSSASLSVSSPSIFRKYELPFVQKASELCKGADIPAHLHVCGRSWEIVQMVAEESELDSMEPIEPPPSGNVDVVEAKKRYGHKLAFKGNLNTTGFMLFAKPQEIVDECKRLIDTVGRDGGFILSTGDQCGRDTPDQNIVAMVETAHSYGVYS